MLKGGLPFAVEMPRPSEETVAVLKEAKRISRDPSVPGYSSMEELKKALPED